MSKKAKTEKTQKVDNQPKEDNVMDDLKKFNEPERSSDSENVEATEEKVEEPKKDDSNWLINNKFKNDEEGAQGLATAYKELQSKSDKERNEYKAEMSRMEKMKQLDTILSKHPSVVEAMQDELKRLDTDGNKPKKPEDYDILEESVDGTSSFKWRQEYDKYLVSIGKNEAKKEVEILRSEMARKDATQKRVSKLRDMGLSDDDIKGYFTFMTEKKNLTDDNLVPIWQHLSGKKSFSTSGSTSDNANPEPKRVSAAAVEGKAPEIKQPEEKEKEQFWNGIMKNARTTT